MDGEVTIPSGVTLSLGSGTEVSFSPGALIVSGTLEAGPGVAFRSSNRFTPSPSAWSGIRVESGGSADLSGATIRDGGGCVQAHTSGTVTMTNATLSNCDEEVSLSTKRPQPGVALTASLEGVSAGSWQWQGRNDSDSAPWSDLSGSSTSASYTPLRGDLGRQLRAMVRYVPDAGSYSRFVQSEPTRGVMLPPPTGFEVWPDHEAVLLLWDASADAGITHWRYGKRKRPAKMEWTKVADGDVDSLEYEGRRIRYIRVEDLTNGVEYLFRVRAKSAAAEGVLTDPVLVTPVQPQVAYGASSYEAREGGEPVPVEVSLSPKATRAVALPVTVTADAGTEAGDYTVAGLAEEMLSFALGDSTRSFTLTANEDSDGNDETVSLGFGDLPEGVSAGTPSSAQVTLKDVTVPRTVTYEFSRYEAIEGGAAKTVTVNMTPPAHRLLKIPITRTPLTGDFRMTWPGIVDTLFFSPGPGASAQSFTITATEDTDRADEEVTLGFGALPEGVIAGTPVRAAVSLVDVDSRFAENWRFADTQAPTGFEPFRFRARS